MTDVLLFLLQNFQVEVPREPTPDEDSEDSENGIAVNPFDH